LKAYSEQVRQLADEGTDAIYLWGVHADSLVSQGKLDLIAKAVEIAKGHHGVRGEPNQRRFLYQDAAPPQLSHCTEAK
jgi:hypothetical protein